MLTQNLIILWTSPSFSFVLYQQMCVIGGDHVVEHTEAISLLCLKQPS